jgi:lambda family phage portal protein
LVKRSRDQFKNNAWARRGCTLIGIEGIGTGITVKLTETPGTKRSAARIRKWLNSPDATIGGRANYFKAQKLVTDEMVMGGNVFVRKIRRREPRSGIPLRLQLLGIEHLDRQVDGPLMSKDVKDKVVGSIINGIEYDTDLNRVAYWFKKAVSNDVFEVTSIDPIRVPARDVIHVYREDEVGMQIGMPWLAPALWTARDLVEYQDAQLIRQKMAAALMMKRTRPNAGQPSELAGTEERPMTDVIEPGTTLWLDTDENADYLNPPTVDGFDTATKLSLRQIAVALPVSYEALSGDLSDTNYSSGRLGWHLFSRSLEQLIWLEIVPHFCEGVMEWLREAEMLDPDALPETHTPPRREMLDPSKEIPPTIEAIRAGLSSRQAEVRRRGEDIEEIDKEQAEDNARSDGLGLLYDSDGRRPKTGGQAPAADPAPELTPKKR